TRQTIQQKESAELNGAEAQREGARAAMGRGDLLEARAKLRGSLELQDSVLGRALWWRLTREPLLWRHELEVPFNSVAFSPDGRMVAAAGNDGLVHLVDVATLGARLLRGLEGVARMTVFSPDGKMVAASAHGGPIAVWELESGAVRNLRGHRGEVAGLSFSPDGKQIASGGVDGTIRLWDLALAREQKTVATEMGPLGQVVFSPDGETVASAGAQDGVVRLWDAASGKAVGSYSMPGQAHALAFSPCGRMLAASGAFAGIRIVELGTESRPESRTSELDAHGGPVPSIAFSADGSLLVAAGAADDSVRIWELPAGRPYTVLRGHGDVVVSVAISPDQELVASASRDNSLRLWRAVRTAEEEPARGHAGQVASVAFGPDSRLVASAGFDGRVRVWDAATGSERMVLGLGSHAGAAVDLAISPAGDLLAAGGEDRVVRIYAIPAGKEERVLSGHRDTITSIVFSPDGQSLATASRDASIRLWSVTTGKQKSELSGHGDAVWGVDFSSDGAALISAGADKTVRLWDIASGQSRVLGTHDARARWVDFDARGERVVSSGDDHKIRIWDVTSGESQLVVEHPQVGYRPSFHPDGRRLGIPWADGTARIVDLQSGSSVQLCGHRGEVNHIRFSPDGKLVATGGSDGTVRLWNSDSGLPLWRGPALFASPPELFNQLGWLALDSGVRESKTDPPRWRRAVEQRARLSSAASDGRLLCLHTYDDHIEMWDMRSDGLIRDDAQQGVDRIIASPHGCLFLSQGRARLLATSQARRELAVDASAIALGESGIMVATRNKIVLFDSTGVERSSVPSDGGVTALARTNHWIVVGFEDGNIQLLAPDSKQASPRFAFGTVPVSPVTVLMEGPGSTVAAGYANGLVGVWNLDNGSQLEAAKLHGPVNQLLLVGSRLHAATDLGDHLSLDVGIFYQTYCELLTDIWQHVPVVWEHGFPVLRQPSRRHECYRSRQ
ncbi:MAG: hypothetical protein V2A73_12995, partial [Pseudomonadota bacterium]